MKRFMVLFGILACVNFMAFAQEEIEKEQIETGWISVGFSWGNYFDSGTDIGNFYSGSPGINFNAYSFLDKKFIGFFGNIGLQFPVVNTIENGYSPIIHGNYILGVGFRHKINERLNLHFGIGPSLDQYSLLNRVNDNIKSTDYRLTWGIGGDVGLKYDLTDSIYIDVGTILSYGFGTYRIVQSTTDNWTNTKTELDGWIINSVFGIKPYIGIGFNIYGKTSKAKLGKPKFEN
jgi:hypothetical protein